ncbi:MAG: type IV pilus biogenesis/stability protein PilW [Sinobacteraceae bacterium]|nr:type IV pilus biogenesis/stability protein PilW [Nevskiaceae bacterium]
MTVSTRRLSGINLVRRGAVLLTAVSYVQRGAVLLGVALIAGCASGSSSSREHRRDDAANYNTQLGIDYMKQGDLPLAKEKLDRAMSENPSDPGVHSAMAMLEDRLGHPDKADQQFKDALRLGHNSPDTLNNYAVYLCRNGRTDEGVKRFEEAAHNALYRTPEAAYTNAGVCLRAARRDTQAAMSFQRALQAKPNYAEAAFQLSELDLQRGELSEARAELDRYLAAYEATPDLLLVGVQIAQKQGDRMAEERYARKLRLDFPSSDQARALTSLTHPQG